MVSGQAQTHASQLPPCMVIAAPQGRSGKTTVCIGLCTAFKRRGFTVQPFKKGPDYIDPSWLTAASGRSCRNLDVILMSPESMLTSFTRACRGADLAIIEGAMGLYDGFDTGERGSTAQIARLINSPVILVINVTRMTQSIAAMVTGYQHFEPETNIAGVILNNVANSRHERKLVTAVEQHCGIPVVGSVPRDRNLKITERHLGLVPYREVEPGLAIDHICRNLEDNLNLDSILDIARSTQDSDTVETITPENKPTVVRLGVMSDHVFTFYYPENLEALTQAGAELVFFNSVGAQELPCIDGLYIGGGFPELFLKELEANKGLRQDIARAIEDGLPVYAECAGLMYLCQGIQWHGEWHEMVGVIPAEVTICQQPQGHGYAMVEVSDENPWLPVGLTFWGHEFHHSRLSESGDLKFAYLMRRGGGIDSQKDGIIYKNVLATYTHLHALGVPQWAEAFVSLALKARKCQPSFITKRR